MYNLSELQNALGKKFGYPPDKTLEIAQRLCETHKILYYPRTDLPPYTPSNNMLPTYEVYSYGTYVDLYEMSLQVRLLLYRIMAILFLVLEEIIHNKSL